MVLWGGLQPVLIGLIAGVIGSLIVGRPIESLLFGVTAADPVTIAGVVALLLIVSIGALILPALRAIRVSPLDALRYE